MDGMFRWWNHRRGKRRTRRFLFNSFIPSFSHSGSKGNGGFYYLIVWSDRWIRVVPKRNQFSPRGFGHRDMTRGHSALHFEQRIVKQIWSTPFSPLLWFVSSLFLPNEKEREKQAVEGEFDKESRDMVMYLRYEEGGGGVGGGTS